MGTAAAAIRTDFHVHCWDVSSVPDEVHEARVASWRARRGLRAGEGPTVDDLKARMQDPDGTLLVEDLNAAGLDRGLLIGLDWGLMGKPTPATAPEAGLAHGLGVVRRWPGRFRFVFGIDPRRPDAVEHVRHALEHPEVAGIKFYPPTGFSVADDACSPVIEEIVRGGRFLMVHTGRQTYPFLLENGRVEAIGEVQRHFPDLVVVLAHAGCPFWGEEAIEVASGHPTTFVDVSGWGALVAREPDRVRRFLELAFDVLGPHRVLFGSDHLSGPKLSGDRSPIGAWKQWFADVASGCGVDLDDVERAAAGLMDMGATR